MKNRSLEQIADLMSKGQITGYKVIDDEYIQFSNVNGNNYIVYQNMLQKLIKFYLIKIKKMENYLLTYINSDSETSDN